MSITNKDILRFYGWSEKPTILECAEKAYIDLCRTMSYDKPDNPNIDKNIERKYEYDKEDYKKSINNLIVESINELLEDASKEFNIWHNETCDSIVTFSNKHAIIKNKRFKYGQAQKWLNMTFKNMLILVTLLGDEILGVKLNQRFKNIERSLHVPVDNDIMEKAWKEFGVKIPYKNAKTNGEASGAYKAPSSSLYSSKPWSQWSDTDYIQFQNTLRAKIIASSSYDSPIDWEFKEWNRK